MFGTPATPPRRVPRRWRPAAPARRWRRSGWCRGTPRQGGAAGRSCAVSVNLTRRPYRLAAGILDVGRPGRLDKFYDGAGHRYVGEFLGHLAAVLVSPSEEVEHLLTRLRLLLHLVHEDEAGAGNRPALFARLIGQQQ